MNGKTYYIFKCKVAAKDMASKVTAQMIDGNDVYNMYSYSVRDYAKYLLDHQNESETYRTAAPLVIAMLNYGAAAQLYFGVNTGDLANSILAVEDIIYREFTVDEMEVPPSEVALDEEIFEGATLSLKSQTTLSIYFKSDQRLTFSCDGMTVEKDEADGYQIARIRNIPAVRLSDTFTLTVNGLGTVKFSPLNYCKNVLTNDDTGSRLKDVAGALYTYSHLADYYFGKKQPVANEEPAD